MRLICPNCDAQYEVDARVIPKEGRDVQCSSCGHTWFEAHPDTMVPFAVPEAPAERPAPSADEPASQQVTPADEPTAAVEPATDAAATYRRDEPTGPDPAAAPGGVKESRTDPFVQAPPPQEDTAGGDDRTSPDATGPGLAGGGSSDGEAGPARRPLDSDVAALLREEAEREARARRAENASIESQPDLGLADARKTAGPRRPSPVEGKVPEPDRPSVDDLADADFAVDQAPTSRRDLLPDIDEINSTLRATGDRQVHALESDKTEVPETRGGGFRLGFGLTVCVGLALLALYSYAPRIGERFPSIAPVVQNYSAGVDTARLWLDDMMQRTIESLNAED